MDIFAIIKLLGGLAMFLYGIEIMGDGLKNSSGAALKKVLEKVTGNAILDARRIYVLGVRSASALASFLGYYLNLMFEDVHTITASGTGQVLEKLISAGPDDVVIAFSYPRYSTSTVTGASFCHSKGAKIVAMTDSRTSPLGQTSDFVLQTKSDMASLVDSLVAPLSVVNALVVALAARREEKLAKTFSRLEEIWEKYQVYEKQDD